MVSYRTFFSTFTGRSGTSRNVEAARGAGADGDSAETAEARPARPIATAGWRRLITSTPTDFVGAAILPGLIPNVAGVFRCVPRLAGPSAASQRFSPTAPNLGSSVERPTHLGLA